MSLAGRHVLVTGGNGLVGSNLARALLVAGCRVRVLDRRDARLWREDIDRIELLRGDLRDPAALAGALDDVDLVFHQAALTPIEAGAEEFLSANAAATGALFERIAAERLPVRKVVVASSLGVYGEGSYCCPVDGVVTPRPRPRAQLERGDWEPRCATCGASLAWAPTREDASIAPVTAYAISKFAAERLALALGERAGVPTVALRYVVVYGPGQALSNSYSSVLATFGGRLERDEPPLLFEDGRQVRDWVFVDDVVRANLFAAEDERLDFAAWNVGSGAPCSVRELAESLGRALGKSVEPQATGRFRVGDTRHLVLDTSRLTRFGWTARVALDEGLGRYAAWLRASDEGRASDGPER